MPFWNDCYGPNESVESSPNESLESSSVVETVVNECSQTYSVCDGLYPNSYSGFRGCMDRGGC